MDVPPPAAVDVDVTIAPSAGEPKGLAEGDGEGIDK
jgi:hypothetical protein